MEGMFAFFLESSFLGLLVFGEKRLGPARPLPGGRWRCSLGTWLSGYFIIVHQRVHAASGRPRRRRRRRAAARGFLGLPAEPVGARAVRAQHGAAVVTGVVRGGRRRRVLCAAGQFTSSRRALPEDRRDRGPGVERARRRSRPAICRPSWSRSISPWRWPRWRAGSRAARMAGIALIGQPNVATRRLDNPIVVPGVLSFLAYGTFRSEVRGLNDVPARTSGPTTSSCSTTPSTSWRASARCSSRVMGVAALLLWRGRLLTHAAAALGADARLPVPLHRDDRRLDDRRSSDASPGWSTGCCGPPTAPVPACTPARRCSRSSASRASTSCSACCSSSSSDARLRTVRYRWRPAGPADTGPPGATTGRTAWLTTLVRHRDRVMLVVYVVLDGFDFGAGTLHLFVAKTRRGAPRRSWPPSARSGMATRCGCSPRAACCSSPSRPCSPQVCRGSTSRFSRALDVDLCAVSRSSSGATSITRLWRRPGTASSRVASAALPVLFGAALGNLVRGCRSTRTGGSRSRSSPISPRDRRWASSTGTP